MNSDVLNKGYEPHAVERKWYQYWEDNGSFAAREEDAAPAYSIVIPPPNVTGVLHMGHALNITLQDTLCRYRRLRGDNVLWMPGTDHAGIATQNVVERKLAEDGTDRYALGREKFIEAVWQWREKYGSAIINQLKRLGASCDWPRERFTMDKGLSQAVRKVFVQLYDEGLIYRGDYIINWCHRCHTALADLEVEHEDVEGHLYHIRYPFAREEDGIVVATTRPETMLGDTAIAVHPDDERYRYLVGKHAVLPLVGRRLIIVADDYADPETGSGAVKITPGHDFNDFEVGRRHELEMINIFDENAHLNDAVPERYRGLDRYAAREKVVADLQAEGLLERIEDHRHTVPHGDRSNVAIEPWLTDQWYVDAATLAKPAIEAVEQGRTRFVPKLYENTYFEWMRNIQPWCVSRQIWWGHQIPAWHGPDGEIFVEMSEAEARAAAERHYGKTVELTRDPDVLDTWFSSALWPFSTLGWPEKTPELDRYYPGEVLVTGYDIIFFWVARMMMMGIHFMGEVPFREVHIHGLVRDEFGQKMSKSKGNIMDPLDVIDRYGCDALRFTLAALAVPAGRDIKLAESRVEGYRNFTTKIWNAARYCEMNGATLDPTFDPAACTLRVNRWIVGKVMQTAGKLRAALDSYRLNEAASVLYHFTWDEFCDWYIEFTKPILTGADQAAAAETRAAMGWAMGRLLHLLHPLMPFVSEELWAQLSGDPDALLIRADFPEPDAALIDAEADAEVDWVIRLISEVRTVRAEVNVPAKAMVKLLLRSASETTLARVAAQDETIRRLARLESIAPLDGEVPQGAVQTVIDEATAVLPLAGVIDIAQEQIRLRKEIEKVRGDIAKVDKKLANEQFLSKAPTEVVEKQKDQRAEAVLVRDKLAAALDRLAGL